MEKKKISLSLNKEVIDQLDKVQLSQIIGGDDITTLFGSNCYNTDPVAHPCCAGEPTISGACISYTSRTDTTPGSCCQC